MLLTPSYIPRDKLLISFQEVPIFNSRHSLASPISPLLSVNDIPKSRKSSLLPPSNEKPPQANILSILAVGKLRSKAEQTKQFIKDQTVNNSSRRSPMNLTINDIEIAKIVLKVLMKPADQRNAQEHSFLAKTLKNEVFFQEIKKNTEKDVFHKVFFELRHMFYAKTRIIYKKGDIIKKAMLILEGEIAFLALRKPNEGVREIIEIKDPNMKKFMEFIKTNFSDYSLKEVIKVGGAVGLKELMNEKDQNSEFLMIAIENTHFLAIQKETFQKLKDEYKIKLLNEKLDFLKSYAMFAKWSTNNLKLLLDSCEIKAFAYSSVIFKENDPANCLYLIKSGEIEISKIVRLDLNTQDLEFPSYEAIFEQNRFIKHSSFTSLNRVWSAKESRQSHQRMIVSKLCSGQFFGENELFSKDSHSRLSRASVKSQFAELYIVPRQKFLELSSLLNSLSVVKDFSDSKENWRENLLKTSQKSLISSKKDIRKTLEFPKEIASLKIEDFQLISHVKNFRLLDKEFQILKGKRPIRGEYKENERPKTTRNMKKPIMINSLNNESSEEKEFRDFGLKIWSNSPKNKEKRQKEIERRVFSGKLKKQEKNEFFSDFMVGKKIAEEKGFRERIQKMKIYKRLKVDRMFPKKEFF